MSDSNRDYLDSLEQPEGNFFFGVFPDSNLDSESPLDPTLSEPSLPQETENTDSDSQGQIDLSLLPDAANNWLDEHGFTTGEQPALPSIIADFPYATMDEAYEEYYNQNSCQHLQSPKVASQTKNRLMRTTLRYSR